MLRGARDEQFEMEGLRKDVELTLGPAVLFAIVCGLLLVCGLCFGIGYTAGRRNGSQTPSAKSAASGQTLAEQAATSVHKPAATVAVPAVQAASNAGQPTGMASAAVPGAADSSTAQAVRPALTSPATVQANSGTTPTSQVQPAFAPSAGIMVQIAAVSHMEDANVLMAALLKRGYAVTARREPADSLIHVQVGPFASTAEANAMSQRLLNDGYNAVVMP